MISRLLRIRVEVYGVKDLHIVPLSRMGQRLADVFKAGAKVVPAVAGDQNEALAWVDEVKFCKAAFPRGVGTHPGDHVEQGIHDGVAGDMDGIVMASGRVLKTVRTFMR